MSKLKVLVVDDDSGIRTLVCDSLTRNGYVALQAAHGEAGLVQARKGHPDLVICDVMMPGLGGHEMVRQLRRTSAVPVIFLSGRCDDVDKVVGLSLGADDYVTKPFSLPELMARVEVVLRRTRAPNDDGALLRLGDLEVDRERHEVRVKGRPASLAPREFDLLVMLADQEGKVVSRETIVERFWGVDDGAEVSTRTVDQHVARLRRKLTSEGARVLTVKKAGYRLRFNERTT